MTFAVAAIVLGSLNSASASLPALLMGLGTDFTILMYARYVEERQGGASVASATERMVGLTGLGVFTGAITSAGTFYAMCFGSYRGLRDLGFLVGTGILICAVAILVPAPRDDRDARRRAQAPGGQGQEAPPSVVGLRASHDARSVRHRRLAIGTVAALTLAGARLALRLDFDAGVDSLRSNHAPSFAVQKEVAEKFGASLSYMMAIAEGSTVDEAVRRTHAIEERLKPFLADGTVGSYESHPDVPSSRRAAGSRHRRDQARKSRARSTSVASARRSRAAFAENGFREEAFDEYLDQLKRFLAPARPITLEDLEQQRPRPHRRALRPP